MIKSNFDTSAPNNLLPIEYRNGKKIYTANSVTRFGATLAKSFAIFESLFSIYNNFEPT